MKYEIKPSSRFKKDENSSAPQGPSQKALRGAVM